MQTILFKSKEFKLFGIPNILSDRFQVTIEKGDASVDEIIDEVDGCNQIRILEDGEIKSVHTNYNRVFAVSIIPNNLRGDKMRVSVELQNTGLQDQINSLFTKLNQLQKQTATQHDDIASINAQITTMSDTQQGAIEDLGTEIANLAESQTTQDSAIEDLGTMIAEFAEENNNTPSEEK